MSGRFHLGNVDIGLLRLFLQVVESGGFTGAQAHANLSLSAISTRIATLEKRLNLCLCHRGRSGFSLTADGRRVHAATLQLFAAIGTFHSAVAAENELTGEVRIAVSDAFVSLPQFRLSDAVARFRERPGNGAFLRVRILSYEQQLHELQSDTVDIGFATFPYAPRWLEVRPIFQSRQILCCARGHALFRRAARATVAEILSFPFVMRGDARPRQMLAAIAALPAAAEAVSAEGRAHLILSGHFLGYLPEPYAAHWIARGEMRALATQTSAYDIPLHMALRATVRDRPAIAAFIDDFLARPRA